MGILQAFREWYQLRQVRAAIKRDPWLHSVVDFANKIFTDPAYLDDNPVTVYLRKGASQELREKWGVALSRELLSVAASNDRIVACREWIFRICEQYAPVRVLLVSPQESTRSAARDMYHPCVTGLYDHVEELLQKDSELHEIYRREGGLAEAREFIRIFSLCKHLELKIADFARLALGDSPEGNQDWLTPLFNSMCALCESNYRRTLGLPQLCDELAILKEQVTLQHNVLKGYKNPLEGVAFASRCGQD